VWGVGCRLDQSFLRKGMSLSYVGRNYNLKDLKDLSRSARARVLHPRGEESGAGLRRGAVARRPEAGTDVRISRVARTRERASRVGARGHRVAVVRAACNHLDD